MYENLEFKCDPDSKHHNAGNGGKLRHTGTAGLGADWDDEEEELCVDSRRSWCVEGTACMEVREKQHVGVQSEECPQSALGSHSRVWKAARNSEIFYVSVRNSTLGRLNWKLARRFLQEGRVTPGKR